jgi:serine/threonine protein kinase
LPLSRIQRENWDFETHSRSDIWSFGAVLYEMLAGKRAFAGESVSDTLATVLKLEPNWNALRAGTPPSILKLLPRCLTKDRKQRLQAIGDARFTLETPPAEEPASAQSLSQSSIVGWALGGAALLGLMALAFVHFREVAPVEHLFIRCVNKSRAVREFDALSALAATPRYPNPIGFACWPSLRHWASSSSSAWTSSWSSRRLLRVQ